MPVLRYSAARYSALNARCEGSRLASSFVCLSFTVQRDAKKLVWKECTVGIINGIVVGLVTAGIAWMWQGSPFLGLVIGLAMIVNLAVAGLAGSAIPILMKKFGLDPAQSSSIILTTVTDIIGFFAFLGFAVVFEEQLLLAT